MLAAEALIRWVHPTLGVLSPAEFLPFAEDAGLMSQITRLVLADAKRTVCAVAGRGHRNDRVGQRVGTGAARGGIPRVLRARPRGTRPTADRAWSSKLTETSIITDFDQTQRVIQELADSGVVVSIDDFGAGFTSLAHLSGLAVKELKLDRSFIVKLTENGTQREQDLVRATIELGHALGLSIVAEGIEEQAHP